MESYGGEPSRHVGDLPAMAADRYGSKTAAAFLDQELSFAELEAAEERLGGPLASSREL